MIAGLSMPSGAFQQQAALKDQLSFFSEARRSLFGYAGK